MNAEQYLNEALGGNMNIGTLKPLAWHEIMEGYARHKLAEALKPSHNSDYATALYKLLDELYYDGERTDAKIVAGVEAIQRLNASHFA